MRNFNVNLMRVTYLHYITAKAAINYPWTHTTSGAWHYLSYWNSTTGQARVSLAGIHYPDTSKYFGDTGTMNASKQLKQRGWQIDHQIYMANHFRAAGDIQDILFGAKTKKSMIMRFFIAFTSRDTTWIDHRRVAFQPDSKAMLTCGCSNGGRKLPILTIKLKLIIDIH